MSSVLKFRSISLVPASTARSCLCRSANGDLQSELRSDLTCGADISQRRVPATRAGNQPHRDYLNHVTYRKE